MKKVALVGCGNLGTIIAQGIKKLLGEYYILAGLMDKRPDAARALAEDCGGKMCFSLGELLALKPDYVVEAANLTVLREIALPVLRAGADLIPLSIGAFADSRFYRQTLETAEKNDRRVYIVSGAIGGFDIMQTAILSGQVSASITTLKAPASLAGAPGLDGISLPSDQGVKIFSGSARQAIEKFPKNVNVAVALALNTVGVDQTKVQIYSVPGLKHNTHQISLKGDFGEAKIEIASRPSEHNPKSSVTAANSVLSKLKNLASPISFC